MYCVKHWIPRPSFPTRLYHLGRLFPTRLYHLHPCRRASMQAGLRRNDGGLGSGIRQEWQRGYRDGDKLTLPPPSSFRRRPESTLTGVQAGLRPNDGKGNRQILIVSLTIATQKRYSCLPATGISENNPNISRISDSIRVSSSSPLPAFIAGYFFRGPRQAAHQGAEEDP